MTQEDPQRKKEREELLRGIKIPEPDEFYYNLKPINVERAVALLQSWYEEDDSDEPQAETWEYLKRVLDEDRLTPHRKLFP